MTYLDVECARVLRFWHLALFRVSYTIYNTPVSSTIFSPQFLRSVSHNNNNINNKHNK